jgi:hypothetical protein
MNMFVVFKKNDGCRCFCTNDSNEALTVPQRLNWSRLRWTG